jgi:hypothetical protein
MRFLPFILNLGAAAFAFAAVGAAWVWFIGSHVERCILNGGGGIAGGSTIPTIILYSQDRDLGIMWSYSCVLNEHMVHIPFSVAATVPAILSLGLFVAARKLDHAKSGFEVIQPVNLP